MPYWQLYYHLVWATKHREPLITEALEPEIHGFIRSKAIGLGGTVLAIGGVQDHVHVVTTIPPSVSVSRFVAQLKGASSKRAREITIFAWQAGYGAFSLDKKRAPRLVDYVRQQKEHHQRGSTIPALEHVAS